MLDTVTGLRLLHVLGGGILFGGRVATLCLFEYLVTGRDPALAARAARAVLGLELVVVAPAVAVQLATGLALADAGSATLATPWLATSLALFTAVGIVWIPLLVSLWQMSTLAGRCRAEGLGLPRRFERLLWRWRCLEGLVLAAVVALSWLMVARPPSLA